MKGNKKYIYICLAVIIIAIIGYVVIYKLDILKKAQCQEWGYKNPLTRLVALFS